MTEKEAVNKAINDLDIAKSLNGTLEKKLTKIILGQVFISGKLEGLRQVEEEIKKDGS